MDDIVYECVSHLDECTCLVCLMGAEIKRLKEVITDFVEAREALNKNEWCDDSGAFRSAYQDASRSLESEARRG